ncbi:hypothetical protein ACH4L7_10445 [Streptomyces anulatus]
MPYHGLDAFAEDEAAAFFGREGPTADLAHRLQASPDQPIDRFLVVVGASGSGKSSSVKAGVIPRLREDVRVRARTASRTTCRLRRRSRAIRARLHNRFGVPISVSAK